jgi:flagellar basal body rod protein FlgF
VFSCVNTNDNNLLHEYTLLHTDLSNIKTWGYKSFFNSESNKASENINVSRGSFVWTGLETDCAIAGEGFFKIRLENGLAGYTRSGDFIIDYDGNIVTSDNKYFLYDNIWLGESFLFDTLKITKDHNVYIDVPDKNGNRTETRVGELLTYNIPGELLSHYKDAVYVIKDNAEYTEEIIFDTTIYQGILEYSNVHIMPTVLRMYYILSVINENLIPNKEFKKELLKIQIEAMAGDDDYVLYSTMSALNRRLLTIIENHVSDKQTTDASDYEKNILDKYLDGKYYYLENILPFLKYDY